MDLIHLFNGCLPVAGYAEHGEAQARIGGTLCQKKWGTASNAKIEDPRLLDLHAVIYTERHFGLSLSFCLVLHSSLLESFPSSPLH